VETEKEEELIRKAVAEINSKVKIFANNYSFKDNQDLLAMVSLEIMTKLLSKETMTSSQKEEILNELHLLDNILSS
jgi:cell division protein ZapA (FtsZ GTPase activity inhibitor)